MSKFDLQIDGKGKSTSKGNWDWYYGGGDEAWTSKESAITGVPLAIRPGKTVGIIKSSKIVEYIWHNDDLTDAGLVLKYPKEDLDILPVFDSIDQATQAIGVGKKFRWSEANYDGVPSLNNSSIGVT